MQNSIRVGAACAVFTCAWFAHAAPQQKPAAAAAGDTVEVRVWKENGPRERSVDILFIGDGYPRKELNTKYWTDVNRYAKRLFQDPPFNWYPDRFNVRAAFVESKERDCKAEPSATKPATALDCAFDSKSGRLLVFRDEKRLEKIVRDAGDTDIVFVMVNTERYGGAGTTLDSIEVRGRSLPAPTFAAQDTTSFLIAVHELGHSFANLADEYVDLPLINRYLVPASGDLTEANVSLERSFDRKSADTLRASVKWKHFLDLPGAKGKTWFFEGAYYRDKGVFRPWEHCRMRSHDDDFCPICCEEVTKAIFAATGEKFDDAAYHKAHALSGWR